jgi:hypothetical protein
LFRGEFAEQGIEFAALGPGFGGEIEPDEAFDEVDGNAAPLGISEAEVVLGDGVAGLGFLAQNGEGRGHGRIFGGADNEGQRERGGEKAESGADGRSHDAEIIGGPGERRQ